MDVKKSESGWRKMKRYVSPDGTVYRVVDRSFTGGGWNIPAFYVFAEFTDGGSARWSAKLVSRREAEEYLDWHGRRRGWTAEEK